MALLFNSSFGINCLMLLAGAFFTIFAINNYSEFFGRNGYFPHTRIGDMDLMFLYIFFSIISIILYGLFVGITAKNNPFIVLTMTAVAIYLITVWGNKLSLMFETYRHRWSKQKSK